MAASTSRLSTSRTRSDGEHAKRVNSSVECERIERSQFLSPCGGAKPLAKTFAHGINITRISAPGNFKTWPWSFSRNRQDITEEPCIDAKEETIRNRTARVDASFSSGYTLHCKASTARGYFELGNHRNNNTRSPLLKAWLSTEEIRNQFNNVGEDTQGLFLPAAK